MSPVQKFLSLFLLEALMAIDVPPDVKKAQKLIIVLGIAFLVSSIAVLTIVIFIIYPSR